MPNWTPRKQQFAVNKYHQIEFIEDLHLSVLLQFKLKFNFVGSSSIVERLPNGKEILKKEIIHRADWGRGPLLSPHLADSKLFREYSRKFEWLYSVFTSKRHLWLSSCCFRAVCVRIWVEGESLLHSIEYFQECENLLFSFKRKTCRYSSELRNSVGQADLPPPTGSTSNRCSALCTCSIRRIF